MINFDPVDFSGFGFRLYQGKNYEAMQKYEPKHLHADTHIQRISSNKTDNKSQVSIYENLISVYIFNS